MTFCIYPRIEFSKNREDLKIEGRICHPFSVLEAFTKVVQSCVGPKHLS
jgi:hypothetical protein